MRELKAEDIKIGQKLLMISPLMEYPTATYRCVVKEIYPRYVNVEAVINQDTMTDSPFGEPTPYIVSIPKTDFYNLDDKYKHYYAVS